MNSANKLAIENFFLSEVNNREKIAAIEANNHTYCLQKRIEKFPLIKVFKATHGIAPCHATPYLSRLTVFITQLLDTSFVKCVTTDSYPDLLIMLMGRGQLYQNDHFFY